MAITAGEITTDHIKVVGSLYANDNYMVEKWWGGYKYYKKNSNGAWVEIEADKISDNVKREVMKEKL